MGLASSYVCCLLLVQEFCHEADCIPDAVAIDCAQNLILQVVVGVRGQSQKAIIDLLPLSSQLPLKI